MDNNQTQIRDSMYTLYYNNVYNFTNEDGYRIIPLLNSLTQRKAENILRDCDFPDNYTISQAATWLGVFDKIIVKYNENENLTTSVPFDYESLFVREYEPENFIDVSINVLYNIEADTNLIYLYRPQLERSNINSGNNQELNVNILELLNEIDNYDNFILNIRIPKFDEHYRNAFEMLINN